MSKNHNPTPDTVGLRLRAEERLKEKQKSQRSEGKVSRPAEDARVLIQELRIHQIELEMQNEELRQSRAELETLLGQYTDLYDFAPVGYFSLDRDGTIRRVNLPGAHLLREERARLVNRRFGLFVSPADRPAFNDFLQKVFTNQAAASGKAACEVTLCNKEDRSPSPELSGSRYLDEASRRHVHIEARATEDGQECRVVMSDNTDHKKMDEVRDFLAKYSGPAQGEGFFESLVRYLAENLGMDFICIDRLERNGLTARTVAVWRDGKLEDNLSYALKDTPCGEALGKTVSCFPANVCQVFPRDQALRDLRAESYVGVTLWGHSGQPIGLIAVIGRRPLVNRHLAEAMLQLVAVRAAGEMERQDAEDDLKEASEKYRVLAANVDSMYLVDRDGTYLFMNEGHLKRFGLSLEEVIGKRFSELHSEKESRHFTENVNEVCKTGKPSTTEHRSERDGHFFLRTFTPIIGQSSDGKISQIAIISKDITNIKLAEKKLQDTLESLRKSVSTIIQVMVSAVETRDPYTAGHQIRSADLASAIATQMGLSPEKIEGIRMAGAIHDIGKLSIPAEILSKPIKLSEIEFSLIKEHARQGYEILKNVESPWPLAEMVHQHHERMDGSGYPRNLQEDAILIEARILAVADVVESMASHRPYRPALGIDAALEEIEKNRGIYYDKTVADACLRLFREKRYHFEER